MGLEFILSLISYHSPYALEFYSIHLQLSAVPQIKHAVPCFCLFADAVHSVWDVLFPVCGNMANSYIVFKTQIKWLHLYDIVPVPC